MLISGIPPLPENARDDDAVVKMGHPAIFNG
jgi:hypothetical protein